MEELIIVTITGAGSVSVIEETEVHPTESVTVTLYGPTHNPVAIAVVWLLALTSQSKT